MEDLPEYAYVIDGMNKEFDQLYEENVELKKRIDKSSKIKLLD